MADKNNIESFFKNRLGDHEFPFRESDWTLLEERLNSAGLVDGTSSGGMNIYVKIIVIAAALSLTFLLGWFAHDKLDLFTKSETTTPENSKSAVILETFEKKSDEAIDDQDTTDSGNRVTQLNNDVEAGEDISPENTVNSKNIQQSNPREHEVKKSNDTSAPRVDKSNKKIPGNQKLTGISPNGSKEVSYNALPAPNEVGFQRATSRGQIQEQQYKRAVDTIQPVNKSLLLPLKPKDVFITAPASNRFEIAVSSHYNAFLVSEELKTNQPFSNRWSVGLSFASDFTSVGLDEEKSFAMRGGGHIYYAVFPRVTLSTGVVFSDKKYSTNVDYYAPPEGYWQARTNGTVPDQIDGSCKVVDIPVNVSFTALSKDGFNITTTAGISSYFLLDELYTFTFNQDNPGAAGGWKTDENSFAPLSIINLAAGITIFPKHKIHTGIDVFYKVPIKQVGWGNVELHSMGVQLLLKYRL